MASDPVLIAYGVNRQSDGRVIWTRIGDSYPHDQGSGLTVRLDALPRDGCSIHQQELTALRSDVACGIDDIAAGRISKFDKGTIVMRERQRSHAAASPPNNR